mmetsp:Transcript_18850/g.29538  ORF Transcript_18850/g.29538 Transcript_18850/m.29538 type:complete len:113 (+) Transcript_18850:104-442(+)|eukprot:CAMPEP_0201713534 /NCGR_PEP_ID=MMETSP0593-20130828/341_1 /ASSEMBLY_ACC=CAM_ASM_000672 /TAXON_ID=267983 /ORGANISM="Skeletonema japonicum, Strain CCMP2506" /LENGTH=112 /DNA_ID=CAMNT_0048202691 /DNA_START=64 /DNA_END=402 /DNA_ORIENTATION=-
MNNTALLTLLAVLMAAATNTATAAELLEPMYPENYDYEDVQRETRGVRAPEPDGGLLVQTKLRAGKKLHSTIAQGTTKKARRKEDGLFRATARARDGEADETEKNLFGVPLP